MTKSTLILFLLVTPAAFAADPQPAKPVRKITPGQVIVPTEAMRRPWGELISTDLAKRTVTFRQENTDEIVTANVLPYAELLHHATFGDLQDFRPGERAIFRLHQNEAGEWTWLTYIQDEMNMMNGHKEYFYVDRIDPEKGEFEATQANFDKSFVREKGIVIKTDAATRYWKAGQPAKFADIKVAEKLRTKTHGVGKGKVRVAWEVFLDDESLLKFQAEQKTVHAQRMTKEGLPGYTATSAGRDVTLTLFQESGELARKLKPGERIRLAPAGVDRKPTGSTMTGAVVTQKGEGSLTKVTLTLDQDPTHFAPGSLVRLHKQ